MKPVVELARVRGVRWFIDGSGLAMTALLAVTVVLFGRRMHPEWNVLDMMLFVIAALGFTAASLVMRELAHALAARSLGTPVRSVTIFAWGGGAKLEREPTTPAAELLLAVTGPAFHLIFGSMLGTFAVLALSRLTLTRNIGDILSSGMGTSWTLGLWVAGANVACGVLQLVPAYPLDGGRLVRAWLWHRSGDLESSTKLAAELGRIIAWALVVIAFVLVVDPSSPDAAQDRGGRALAGAWLGALGGFLIAQRAGTRLAAKPAQGDSS